LKPAYRNREIAGNKSVERFGGSLRKIALCDLDPGMDRRKHAKRFRSGAE
jgi:hypothetical protein